MANYFYDANLAITKYNLAKDGELKDLEINGQNIEIGGEVEITLYAWKYSSSYIYTKELPTVAGSTAIILQNPMADNTGTYTPTVPAYIYDVWKYGDDDPVYLNENLETITPVGEASGNYVLLAEVVLASDAKYYLKDEDTKWYQVTKLEVEDVDISDTAVTDASLIAELEAATPETMYSTTYTAPETSEGITYSGNKYTRQSDKDYKIQNIK